MKNKAARTLCVDVERMVLTDIPAHEIRIRLGLRVAAGEFSPADLIHALVDSFVLLLDSVDETSLED